MELQDGLGTRDRAAILAVTCIPAAPGEPGLLQFQVETQDRAQRRTARPIRYQVDFRNPDGSLAQRRQGRAGSFETVGVQGAFGQPGNGSVHIQCVTDQGVSAGLDEVVLVPDASAPSVPYRLGCH
jgi:hypothetical protein